MKNITLKTVAVFAGLGLLSSCGENAWNDHLDGFEKPAVDSKPVNATYALTSADYKAISDLLLEKAETDAEKAEAKAIAGNCYFDKNGVYTAQVALPIFFATEKFPYFLASSGSQIDVEFAEADEVPAELTALGGALEYTVTTDDYKNAWGSDEKFINAFAPMAAADNKLPGILKNSFPDAAEGTYAIVSYYQSETNPVFDSSSEIPVFQGGTYYMVSGSFAAGPLASDKNYGYLSEQPADVANGIAATDHANAFTFVPAAGGFHIKDSYGRYLYQSGTYNSFNVSESIPDDGAVWSVTLAANGQATITNNSVGKWIQYSADYNSWGSYDKESGTLPTLYFAAPNNGDYFLVTESSVGAGPLASDKSYGYLPAVEMAFANGGVLTDQVNAFSFELTDGGYHIKDSYGRYLYQSGTYNSFNLSSSVPESGALWSVTVDKNGFAKITNLSVNKWMQFDGQYSSWGSYDSEKGELPKLYMAAAATSKNMASRSGATEITAREGKNAVYYYNGRQWEVADGVSILNPADYAAMGVADNSLEDAATMIPLYLKNKLIYAQPGDEQFVVYNNNHAALFVYDGSSWTLNNNGLENVCGRFSLNGSDWKFVKYVGKAQFSLFSEDQIMLDRRYLIVYGNTCATPYNVGDKETGYGYLTGTNVEIKDNSIVLPSDANAFMFAQKATINDKEYVAPDGKLLLIDSNGFLNYYDGSHASMQMTKKPTETDGKVDPGQCWTATLNSDGTWKLEASTSAEDIRWLVYSTKYKNFAIYSSITETDFYPSLYLMSE